MAPHSSTLAWKIAWTEEPGRLPSMGSRRVGHDWVTSLSLSCIGEGIGNPLQCSCLENPRDGGAWWAAIYGVAQSRTWLKWLSSSNTVFISWTVCVCRHTDVPVYVFLSETIWKSKKEILQLLAVVVSGRHNNKALRKHGSDSVTLSVIFPQSLMHFSSSSYLRSCLPSRVLMQSVWMLSLFCLEPPDGKIKQLLTFRLMYLSFFFLRLVILCFNHT